MNKDEIDKTLDAETALKLFPEKNYIASDAKWETSRMFTIGVSRNGKADLRMCKCPGCESWFRAFNYTEKTPRIFCSKKCYANSIRKEKPCKFCGAEIDANGGGKLNRVYCSRRCQYAARIGTTLSEEWRASLSRGRLNSDKCRGKNLYNWKGGKETQLLRNKNYYYKRKKGLQVPFDKVFLDKLIIKQDWKCFFCEKSLSEYKAIEHLTPVSRGGDNENWNIVYSCKNCNSRKGQQTLEEYAIKNKRFDWLDKFDVVYAGSLC